VHKGKAVDDVCVRSSLGCSNHEMMEFRILRGGNKAKRKITSLDFRRADFGHFRDLLGRILWNMVLEIRGSRRAH